LAGKTETEKVETVEIDGRRVTRKVKTMSDGSARGAIETTDRWDTHEDINFILAKKTIKMNVA
jgi:hypothetical protein